jgi:hypothetical protein
MTHKPAANNHPAQQAFKVLASIEVTRICHADGCAARQRQRLAGRKRFLQMIRRLSLSLPHAMLHH